MVWVVIVPSVKQKFKENGILLTKKSNMLEIINTENLSEKNF